MIGFLHIAYRSGVANLDALWGVPTLIGAFSLEDSLEE